ncbi:hypothetical protein V2J09_022935 [Rumex salicifolius]
MNQLLSIQLKSTIFPLMPSSTRNPIVKMSWLAIVTRNKNKVFGLENSAGVWMDGKVELEAHVVAFFMELCKETCALQGSYLVRTSPTILMMPPPPVQPGFKWRNLASS